MRDRETLRGNKKHDSSVLDKEMERIKDERDSLVILVKHKEEELALLKAHPVPLQPMPIPGNPMIKTVCDHCHHRGHRATGNKSNKSCPFVKCEGYHYCGLEGKHKEHKQLISEVSSIYYIIYALEPENIYIFTRI